MWHRIWLSLDPEAHQGLGRVPNIRVSVYTLIFLKLPRRIHALGETKPCHGALRCSSWRRSADREITQQTNADWMWRSWAAHVLQHAYILLHLA